MIHSLNLRYTYHMDDKYKITYDKIRDADNILLVTHTHPDGDALGSLCAMAEFLETLGKPYRAYCTDTPPWQYDFLPRIEKITSDKDNLGFDNIDLIIVLDCGDLGRTGLAEVLSARRKEQFAINIDHHPKIDDFADLEIKIPAASSTSELIYDFYRANRIKLNKNMANCVLTGIATDTKFFFFPNTSNKTIDIASELLKRGARLPPILESTWRNKSLPAMKLWGKAIDNIVVNKKYSLAVSVLSEDDLKDTESSTEELEGISEFLSNMNDARVILLLRQEGDIIRGSLRTNHPDADVSKLAQILGGGGHVKAAGFTVTGKLEQTGHGWRII